MNRCPNVHVRSCAVVQFLPQCLACAPEAARKIGPVSALLLITAVSANQLGLLQRLLEGHNQTVVSAAAATALASWARTGTL